MNPSLRKWLQLSFLSLLIVALLGLVMRYKILYALPWVNQRNLLHAHSHFAFSGWITQALMSLLAAYLFQKGNAKAFEKYRPLLYANLITAYGMLLTFPFTGYAFLSITFSTLSIFVSYWFAVKYWLDLNRLTIKSTGHRWFKAAVLFNAVSSFGAFSLAYMLATKNIQPDRYLACVYFFLHFQYNGWFFFACMGLLCCQLNKYGVNENRLRTIYFLFAIACVPAYFLSALWLPVPGFVYALTVVSVFLQLTAWIVLLQSMKKNLAAMQQAIIPFARLLFILCFIALTIKLVLQAGSVIPSLSRLAFGFRPVVIGYLHLVLLGVITLFIIAYSMGCGLVPVNNTIKKGILIFTTGIIVNELLLMIQGIADMNYKPLPFINYLLLLAAFLLFGGMLLTNYGLHAGRYDYTHKTGINE